ncbi:MAG: ACT domain-containing protein [Bacillota bacterium]
MSPLNDHPRGDRVIISVLGKDRVGIIAAVAGVLSAANVNILDISQTILQEYFAMILVADMGNSNADLESLKEKLSVLGTELGLRIDAQHVDVFNYMHRL